MSFTATILTGRHLAASGGRRRLLSCLTTTTGRQSPELVGRPLLQYNYGVNHLTTVDRPPLLHQTMMCRSFSSNDNNNNNDTTIRKSIGKPAALRRPAQFDVLASQSSAVQGSSTSPSPSRPHAITLFPGDFTDDAADPFEDDEDDMDYETVFSSSSVMQEDESEVDETELMIQELRRRERDDQAQRAKWLESSKPPVRKVEIDERGRAYGRGGRKRAQARVWIQPSPFGEVVVNQKSFVDYFDRLSDREHILEPLVATETCGAFDVQVTVRGGGLTGQAGAIRLGLANALNHYNPDKYRPPLKKLGLLTRDARKVERKKIGKVKARKSPQWVKR